MQCGGGEDAEFGERARSELIRAVSSFVETCNKLGKKGELEARIGTWDTVTGAFRPGIHLRSLGQVQRTLDAFGRWEGRTGWICSRDVSYVPSLSAADRVKGEVRCELVSAPYGASEEASVARNTWKRKLGKFDAVARVPALGAGLSAEDSIETPWEEVPESDGFCYGAYGVRFSLASEEPVEPPPGRSESQVTFVRYKARRSWLWGAYRYDLTVVWAGEDSPSGWSPSESAEMQLASGVPSSVELEVEFDPNHVTCEVAFDGNPVAIAESFVDSVAGLMHRDAVLFAKAKSPTDSRNLRTV